MDNNGTEADRLGLLTRALAFAADKHRTQKRKDATKTPYINHPIALANILVNEGGVTNVDVLCAALLHDVIEDCEVKEDELTAEFGPAVAKLVVEVTDDKTKKKAKRKTLQVKHAPTLSHGAKLVKLADKIANLRDILEAPPDWPKKRKRKYFAWAKRVVDGLRGAHEPLEGIFDETYSRGAHQLSFSLEPYDQTGQFTTPQDGQTGKGRKRPLRRFSVTAEDPIYSAGPVTGGRRLTGSSSSGKRDSLIREIEEQSKQGLIDQSRMDSNSETTDEE